MKSKLWRGIFGQLYRIDKGQVLVSNDGGGTWSLSMYNSDPQFFYDGVKRGSIREVK